MPNGNQFSLSEMLKGLGFEGGATDILSSFGVQQPEQYAPGLTRLLGVAGTQAGELGSDYSTMLENLQAGFQTGISGLQAGRQTGMRGLQETWMEQASQLQDIGMFGGRKRRLRRARRAAGREQERLQTGYETAQAGLETGYESDISGAERWMGGQYRDLLASLESGITGYISDIAGRGAEFGGIGDTTSADVQPGGYVGDPDKLEEDTPYDQWLIDHPYGTYAQFQAWYVKQQQLSDIRGATTITGDRPGREFID